MSNFYTLENLMQECASEKTTLQLKGPLTESARIEILMESWAALNKWIESRLAQRKGATVPMLGTFTWDFKRQNGSDVSFRPIFILADSFLKDHLVKRSRIHKMPIVAPTEEINYSNLAIKYSTSLTKDMVFSGVRDICKKIGTYFDRVYEFEIDFTFGVLKSKERRIKFEFDQSKISELLPQNLSNGNLYMPEDYQFDDEPGDEPSTSTQFNYTNQTLGGGRPGTAQSDVSTMSERYDTISGPDAWQRTQFYHPENNKKTVGSLKRTGGSKSKSKLQATGLSSIRLQPLSESMEYDSEPRQSQSAGGASPTSSYQTFNQTDDFSRTSVEDAGRTYSADGLGSTSTGNYDFGAAGGNYGSDMVEQEVPLMSPRLQELVLQIEAREQAARGIRKATNGRLARERVIEDAYLRCLSEAEQAAQHSDSVKQAGDDMLSAWTRRDHAKMEKARNDGRELKLTLDQQSVEARKRAEIERKERREAKMAFFLADNSFSLPVEGGAKNLTLEARREKFCQELGRQIQDKSERRAREKLEKLMEERDYLDHIAVELDMQNAVERTAHLEKQQMLLEAWERDAHIRNVKGLEETGAPSVTTYIRNNLPDVAQLKKKTGFGSMSIGFDSRSNR